MDANHAAIRFYGYTARKLKALRISDINMLDAGEVRLKMNQAVKKDRRHFIFQHRLADGTIRDVEVYSGPVPLEGRKLLYSIVHDITERKQAEEALRLDEARLEALLELTRMIGSPIHDITHFAMEEAVRLTGSTLGYVAFMNENETELTMYAWSDTAMRECQIPDKPIVYPVATTGLWGEAVRQRRAIVTNDYAAPNPWKKGCPEGHVSVSRHMNVPIFDGDRIVLVAGVGNKTAEYDERDVRQLTLLMSGLWTIIVRKRFEEALRDSEKRYRLLIDNAEIAVVVTSLTTGRCLFANERAASVFEIPRSEVIGRQARDHWVHAEDRDRFVADLSATGRLTGYECALKTARGRLLWVLISANIVEYAGERAAFVVYNDISARKRAEEALRDSLETASAMLNAVTESFALIDKGGTVLAANETFALRFGISLDSITGTSDI